MLRIIITILQVATTPITAKQITQEVDYRQLASMADFVGVPRKVMWAVAWEESRTGNKPNHLIVGSGIKFRDPVSGKTIIRCKAIGRMQLNPCIEWTWLNFQCTNKNIWKYEVNIYCGAKYLRYLFDKHGNWEEAIRLYYGEDDYSHTYLHRILATIGHYSLHEMELSIYEDSNNGQ